MPVNISSPHPQRSRLEGRTDLNQLFAGTFDVQLAMRQSMQLFDFAREGEPSDLILDRIERSDLSECLEHALLCVLGVNKLAT